MLNQTQTALAVAEFRITKLKGRLRQAETHLAKYEDSFGESDDNDNALATLRSPSSTGEGKGSPLEDGEENDKDKDEDEDEDNKDEEGEPMSSLTAPTVGEGAPVEDDDKMVDPNSAGERGSALVADDDSWVPAWDTEMTAVASGSAADKQQRKAVKRARRKVAKAARMATSP